MMFVYVNYEPLICNINGEYESKIMWMLKCTPIQADSGIGGGG